MPIRVVIAEDEAIIRLDLREMLEEEGYEVVGETGRGDQAVALCRELQPDVAVLDIKMPGLTGIEVARELTADKVCAIVILTAFSQRDVIAQATEAGALAYLVKPFQKNDVVPAIELALARHREVVELAREVQTLEEELETRKVVDRAKGLLMDRHGMSEADAFAWIQRRAMSERTRKRSVAERIVAGELQP